MLLLGDARGVGDRRFQGFWCNFSREGRLSLFQLLLRGKNCFPYLQNHGPWAGDLRCVELSFFDFVC